MLTSDLLALLQRHPGHYPVVASVTAMDAEECSIITRLAGILHADVRSTAAGPVVVIEIEGGEGDG